MEATIFVPFLLLVFLQFVLFQHCLQAEQSLQSALYRVSKEASLVYAAGEMQDMIPSNMGGDILLSNLSAPVLQKRLEFWYGSLQAPRLKIDLWKNMKVYCRNPDADDLGKILLFYEWAGFWESVPRSLSLTLNDWSGERYASAQPAATVPDALPDDIWQWDNFSRGRTFQSRYGANMPQFHPLICKEDEQDISMIKSIDLTKKTYQNEKSLSGEAASWLNALHDYTDERGRQKKLLVIVPENSPESSLALLRAQSHAALERNIIMEIKRDGISSTP